MAEVTLFDLNVGRAVRGLDKGDGVSHRIDQWGHVLGFTKNPSGETIVKVQWADGSRDPIHPSYLEI